MRDKPGPHYGYVYHYRLPGLRPRRLGCKPVHPLRERVGAAVTGALLALCFGLALLWALMALPIGGWR